MESAFVKTWAHVINLSEAKTYPDTSIPANQCFFSLDWHVNHGYSEISLKPTNHKANISWLYVFIISRASFRVNLDSIVYLNVKELLDMKQASSLSDSNGIRTHNHLVRKRTIWTIYLCLEQSTSEQFFL